MKFTRFCAAEQDLPELVGEREREREREREIRRVSLVLVWAAVVFNFGVLLGWVLGL
jgi:hypothetical protein